MQNKKWLAIIHLAKKQLNLDDEAYRAVLSGAGVSSSKYIETESQFNTVMSAFARLGFLSSGHRVNKHRSTASGSPGMISRRQEYYIKGLWALASRAKDEQSLRRMVRRIGKVDDVSFLPRRAASSLILALRDICWKAGFNPDTDATDAKEVSYAVDGKRSCPRTGRGLSQCVLPPDNGGNRSGQSRQLVESCAGSGS
jgi:hypothetical protein